MYSLSISFCSLTLQHILYTATRTDYVRNWICILYNIQEFGIVIFKDSFPHFNNVQDHNLFLLVYLGYICWIVLFYKKYLLFTFFLVWCSVSREKFVRFTILWNNNIITCFTRCCPLVFSVFQMENFRFYLKLLVF